jgi:hypothetical protein
MRFAVGQAYESVDGKNQAVVTQIRDDGRAGLLRINGGREEWFIKRENGAWLGQALDAERALSCGGHSMAKDHEWEELQAERPTGGYATLLHRMRVPGGYTALLEVRRLRPQQGDGSGGAPAYAQGFHQIARLARASCRNDSARLEARAASNSGFTTFANQRI